MSGGDYDQLEDHALALGHVVVSHNTLETALLCLALRLWSGQTPAEVVRLLGRRTFDERLAMLAGQLPQSDLHPADIDLIDRLLAQARQLSRQRNQAIHARLPHNISALGDAGGLAAGLLAERLAAAFVASDEMGKADDGYAVLPPDQLLLLAAQLDDLAVGLAMASTADGLESTR